MIKDPQLLDLPPAPQLYGPGDTRISSILCHTDHRSFLHILLDVCRTYLWLTHHAPSDRKVHVKKNKNKDA